MFEMIMMMGVGLNVV